MIPPRVQRLTEEIMFVFRVVNYRVVAEYGLQWGVLAIASNCNHGACLLTNQPPGTTKVFPVCMVVPAFVR